MRLASIHTGEGPVAAVLLGEDLVPVSALDAPAGTVRGLLAALDAEGLRELQARAERAGGRIALADAKLCTPVPDPQKIICLGLNYRDHAAET
jgi:2-keto-4-pentenoate hydratase/2-oxohepta-3-ene-1,7-dioic acid hydratase in catechol pathway